MKSLLDFNANSLYYFGLIKLKWERQREQNYKTKKLFHSIQLGIQFMEKKLKKH